MAADEIKKYTVKAFGITRDIVGQRELVVESSGNFTVADMKHRLEIDYPALKGLKSLFIAVNNTYAGETVVLRESDEIALIPPVSGG